MGFLSGILGGGGSSSEVFNLAPRIDTVSTLNPTQQTLLDEVLGPFLTSPGLGGFTPEAFQPSGGRLAPDLSSLERTSLAGLEALALGEGAAGENVTNAQDALNRIFTQGPTDFSDFFNTNVRDPLLEDFNENIIPGIGRRFARNFFSDDRRRVEGEAVGDLTDALTRSRSELAFSTRESDANRILQALGLTNQVALGPDIATLAAGAVPRGVEGDLIGAERDEFIRQQDERDQRIAQILAALGIPAIENIVTAPTVVAGESGGGIGDFLGGVGSLIGGISKTGIFSSREVKEKIGNVDNDKVLAIISKLPIDRWRYIGPYADGEEHIGTYAEDFSDAFGVGNGEVINYIDIFGVLLAGFQALTARVKELEAEKGV